MSDIQIRWLATTALVALSAYARCKVQTKVDRKECWILLVLYGLRLAALGLAWMDEEEASPPHRSAFLILNFLLLVSDAVPLLLWISFGVSIACVAVAFAGNLTIAGGLSVAEVVWWTYCLCRGGSSSSLSQKLYKALSVEEDEEEEVTIEHDPLGARPQAPPPVPQKWNVPLEELNSAITTECRQAPLLTFPTIVSFMQAIDPTMAKMPIKVIGAGTFGVVYRLGNQFVVKVQHIPPPNSPMANQTCINLEREALLPDFLVPGQFARTLPFRAFRNAKLIVLSFTNEPGYKFAAAMLMPFMDGGDASKYVAGSPITFKFQWSPARFLHNVMGLWMDMNIMHHKLHLVHSDIKPANLLLETHSGLLFLADYGLTCYIGSRQSPSQLANLPNCQHAGTRQYMPFLTFANNLVMTASDDLYGLAVSLMEITVSHYMWTLNGNVPRDQLAAIFAYGYQRTAYDFIQVGRQLVASSKNNVERNQLVYAFVGLMYQANPFILKVRPDSGLMITLVRDGGPPNPNVFNVECVLTKKLYQVLDGRLSLPKLQEWTKWVQPQTMDTDASTNRC